MTCTLASSNGCSVPVSMERTKTDAQGKWESWTSALSSTVSRGEDLSAEMTSSVVKAVGQHHVGVAVDCGKGPVAFTKGQLSCTVTTQDKKPVHTTAKLTEKKEGGYTWTVADL